jgi:hypothetical protein
MARDPGSDVHPNLREVLSRAEATPLPRRSEPTPPEGASQLNSIIQRVSGASVAEIDRLIDELQSLRDFLLKEGQRIHRELTDYTRLNQGAVESTRVVAETLMKMKAPQASKDFEMPPL